MFIPSGTTTFHALVDIQAKSTPDAPAVISPTGTLSYRVLVERSNRLAHRLQQAGVARETLVGLCVEKSADMLVGLLAIMKAGGAYLPLDPAYPSERLAYMLEDSATRFIVAETSTSTILALGHETQMILLDAFEPERYSIESPSVEITPDQLAYVMYTSGSTGKPKGVMIEHRNLFSFAQWARERFTPEQSSRVLASTSLSFDVSVCEYTAALSSGGALVVVRNILDLLLAPPAEPISMIISIPSPVAVLVRARVIPASVNTIVLGGETLSYVLANEIYATTHVQELINVWGVTEDTVGTTAYLVPKISQTDPQIGTAIQGRSIYVLAPNLQPVPTGTPGEIFCTGTGVARGYLNRPELTQQRFIPNPFGDSALMYRSGDLAVRSADGTIRFVGRNDQQVKIRGYRVELGEIEAALADHPLIAQVAVIAKKIAGTTNLAMYAVEQKKGTLTLTEVERFLATRLPKYMIPSMLRLLDAMPLSANGKVDRQALQGLARERPSLLQAYVEPRNPIEQQIANLFAELLDLDRVGVHDNFFAIGGQSLLAARVFAELQQLFPKQIHDLETREGERALVTAFWQLPTIEYIASVLQNIPYQIISNPRVEDIRCLQVGSSNRLPIFLLHGVIDGEAFYAWNLALALGPEQPVYTLAPHGLGGKPIPLTIEEMASDYLAQILRIQPHGPYQFAGYCNGGLVCFEMARMLEVAQEQVKTLILIGTPAHNIYFRPLEQALNILRKIFPNISAATSRQWFLRIRARIIQLAVMVLGKRNKDVVNAPTTTREDEIALTVNAYVPKPYGGSATLLFGKDDAYLHVYKPFSDWAKIVKDLNAFSVSGDHRFIESHPEIVAKYFNLAPAIEQIWD